MKVYMQIYKSKIGISIKTILEFINLNSLEL